MTNDIVNALLVRRGKILLARRSLHRRAYPGLWSFPGGHVERRETLDAALIRELREEIGVTPTSFRWWTSIANPNAPNSIVYHMAVLEAWGGEPTPLGDEHTELCWYDLPAAAKLAELALPEYRRLFMELGKP